MSPVDTIARAEISQLKVQLHQITTALRMSINAFDVAGKSIERVIDTLAAPPHRLEPDRAREEIDFLRQARAEMLAMRNLLN